MIRLPLAGAITKSELMALASVSPTVAGNKPKKTWSETSSKSARPAKDFESCETVSVAESAQCSLVQRLAQLLALNFSTSTQRQSASNSGR